MSYPNYDGLITGEIMSVAHSWRHGHCPSPLFECGCVSGRKKRAVREHFAPTTILMSGSVNRPSVTLCECNNLR